jgi:hypothetical protein
MAAVSGEKKDPWNMDKDPWNMEGPGSVRRLISASGRRVVASAEVLVMSQCRRGLVAA